MPFWSKKKVSIEDKDGQFKDNGVFCAMPWVHFHVAQNGNVTPCCQAPWGGEAKLGNINEGTIQEIWNSKTFEGFRKQMLKGKPHQACSRCHEKEKMGWVSLREITNKKYENEINDFIGRKFQSSSYEYPVYFDIRFSNVCNLKCRICNFSSSSSWHSDEVALGNIDSSTPVITNAMIDEEKFYTEFNNQIGSIKEIYFAGGEPLMMDQHYKILDFLIESGNTNCKLFYNTNLSRLKFKDKDVIDYWKHFDFVNLAVSLDDIGVRLEYQRKNIKWNQVVDNFKRIESEVSNVEIMISPTVSVFNIFSISEMHQTLVNENLVQVEDVVPTLLVDPKEFNIQMLSESMKAEVTSIIENHIEWLSSQTIRNEEKLDYVFRQYKNILKYLKHPGDPNARRRFQEKVSSLDSLRDESFIQVFPDLVSLMN